MQPENFRSNQANSGKATRPRRRRLFEFPSDFWHTQGQSTEGNDVTAVIEDTVTPADQADLTARLEATAVSDHAVCATCSLTFSAFQEQRFHFKTDWHKYNAQRKVHGRTPVTEAEFEDLSDIGSVGSLSGSEDGDSGDEGEVGNERFGLQSVDGAAASGAATVQLAEKIEFHNPAEEGSFLVVYKSVLPDQSTLSSLANLGSWAVIMTGGGHFCAALWSKKGVLLKHKTFHRYTSRRKQGGSQAAADDARGAGNRIKSAGATLRRYGEQALQKEVHELLQLWHADLIAAQCIFFRASIREKRDLLVGWQGSPLQSAMKDGRLRKIPIPTRRPTLKEATRIYEGLSTVTLSPTSLLEVARTRQKANDSEARAKAQIAKSINVPLPKPTEKGTDHLKKRVEKPRKLPDAAAEEPKEEEPPKLDEKLVSLFQSCIAGDRNELSKFLEEDKANASITFDVRYLASDEKFQKIQSPLSLLGVVAVGGNVDIVEWLLDHGVSPSVGGSPYLATKSKAVRTLFRTYWGKYPERYDYASSGIPSPLSPADLEAMAEKERQKRKKEREKKKEKAREKAEAAKPPEQQARELRAAAAEARMLGNKCAGCLKRLAGITPFERLAFKYCSTACVAKHREVLNRGR